MDTFCNEELKNFIINVPENVDLNKIREYLNNHLEKLGSTCGFRLLSVYLYSTENETFASGQLRGEFLYRVESTPDENQKVYKYPLSNGGYVEIIATPENGEWNDSNEENFEVITKLLSVIYGRSRAMNYIEYVSTTDALTEVNNTEGLVRYMIKRLKERKIASYCSNFLNVKNMKLINERYGNSYGDEILKSYANKIDSFIGEDGCFARLGGDNFVAVIKNERESELLDFVMQLCVDITMSNGIMDFIKVDSRVGYYYIQPEDDFNVAMNMCSVACRVARQNRNSNIVEYKEEMRTQMMKLREMEEAVPEAIDNEEFVVYYQPKVQLTEDDYILHGAEALIRWKRNGKMVSPGEFVPILEKTGMIREIDFYVLEHVCRDIKKWEKEGLQPVRVSTNFSRWHLGDVDFADHIIRIVEEYGVNPKYLEVEITESYEDEDIEALSRFEEKMKNFGISLSMDDFGSGFSSLQMLKEMAADTVKIDKSLIDDVGKDDKENEIIVSHIIYMIKQLGKELIAEGVEHQEQADFLKKCGCDLIQGFLYGRPMPENDFVERLRAGR